jgi:NadR type nicotinamide-nucleotide adenylyltransferase
MNRSTAVVFGKFWPLHLGHIELIATAARQAGHVLVVVNDGEEDVAIDVRMSWVKEAFPSAEVISAPDLCGHESEQCAASCSERYAQWLLACFGPVDAVISAEPYGDRLARCLSARSVRLAKQRGATGRAIRSDLAGHWHLLSAPARAWYCRRIVIVGAESTGTTTLAHDLAEELRTAWVSEYGREFCEEHGLDHPWTSDDFVHIALKQAEREDQMARSSGPVLVCDTDLLATMVWQERYLGDASSEVRALANCRRPELYVLTGDDIPFVQDGLRDGEHIRHAMTNRFREVLEAMTVPSIEVRGSRRERVSAVVQELTSRFGPAWIKPSMEPSFHGGPQEQLGSDRLIVDAP